MAMESGGLSVADALALQERNRTDDGLFGGGGMGGILFLFFLLMMMGGFGGAGWGAGNNAAAQGALTRAEMQDAIRLSQIESEIGSARTQIAEGFSGATMNMMQGFSAAQMQLAQNGFQTQQGFCDVNRNIDAIRHEAAQNTCMITNVVRDEGRLTRDLITANVIQQLRDEKEVAQITVQNMQQTQDLIHRLQPYPQPSYVVAPPMGFGYPPY